MIRSSNNLFDLKIKDKRLNKDIFILYINMYLDNPELAKQMAEENKSKREEIVKSNKPYLCKKC